jgi:hypothetical protein
MQNELFMRMSREHQYSSKNMARGLKLGSAVIKILTSGRCELWVDMGIWDGTDKRFTKAGVLGSLVSCATGISKQAVFKLKTTTSL